MMKFLIKWFANISALLVVMHVVAGVAIDNMQTVIVAALILGFLNSAIRPIILILTLPITVLTLGAFMLVINGALFYLAAKFVKGFIVTDFWSALWAALIFSIVSSLINSLLSPKINVEHGSFNPGETPRRRTIEKDDIIDVECTSEKKE